MEAEHGSVLGVVDRCGQSKITICSIRVRLEVKIYFYFTIFDVLTAGWPVAMMPGSQDLVCTQLYQVVNMHLCL